MRRLVALISTLLVSGLLATAAVPALADHMPVDETPDYHVVDGRPICGLAGPGLPPPFAGTAIEVGTYNILHSQSEDADADVTDRFDQIVDAMQGVDADVWGLQEVTNDAEHGNQAEKIAHALAARTPGESWQWCWSWSNPHFPGEPDVFPGGGGPLSELTAQFSKLPEGDTSGFKEGLAVVSRHRIDTQNAKFRRLNPRAHEALACPPTANPIDCQFPAVFDHRQVLHTPIVAAGIGQVDVFNTHVAHGLTDHSGDVKYQQIEKALDTIDEWESSGDGFPTYFTGDFNTDAAAADTPDPHDDFDRYQLLVDAGFVDTYAGPECGSQTDPTEGCTSSVDVLTPGPAQDPQRLDSRIDFVWQRLDGWRFGGLTSSVILGDQPVQLDDGRWRWPSDHLGVASKTSVAR